MRYLIGGIIGLLFTIFFLNLKLELLKVYNFGSIVTMQIKDIPRNCEFSKGSYFGSFNFENKIYIKKIPAGYCKDHKIGEFVEMRYLYGIDSILFPDEKLLGEFVAIGVFIFVSILSIIYGYYNR